MTHQGKSEKMDDPRKIGIEEEVTEEIIAAMTLQTLNPGRLPTLLLQLCNLSLEGRSADGFLKNCSASDVDHGQQRFLIPAADAWDHILQHLHPLEDAREGIPIRVYLKDGTYYRLLFMRKGRRRCVITHRGPPEITRWRHVCNAIGLQPGDPMKLWSLRHTRTQELCFFVAKQVIGE